MDGRQAAQHSRASRRRGNPTDRHPSKRTIPRRISTSQATASTPLSRSTTVRYSGPTSAAGSASLSSIGKPSPHTRLVNVWNKTRPSGCPVGPIEPPSKTDTGYTLGRRRYDWRSPASGTGSRRLPRASKSHRLSKSSDRRGAAQVVERLTPAQ